MIRGLQTGGRVGLELLYGSQAGSSFNQSCGATNLQIFSNGATSLCTISFILTQTTVVHVDWSGFATVAVNNVSHQLWLRFDGNLGPDAIASFPNAGGSASGSGDFSFAAGSHTINLAYFTQTLGLLQHDTVTASQTVSF